MKLSKIIKDLFFILPAAILISMLLQSCLWGGVVEEITYDYEVPPPPGPVVINSGITNIAPVAFEDYIANPGIGWQDGPEPFGILGFPETVDYSYRRKISWAVLNPQEGVYDWSALDEQLNEAKASGKQFSFRVYTMVGEGFEGHMIPEWVIDKGAYLFSDGEPDYSNCAYQNEWGIFVERLVERYDGNPDVAFIDISGYGNFNEWSWQDQQTEWDDNWDDFSGSGDSLPQDYFTTLDGQARRRLADMFIGGEYQGHQCRLADGSTAEVDYSYRGFQQTQLLMPYAGIVQSSQYVYARKPDVGFRYDCLGYRGEYVFEKINSVLSDVWKTAPVAFELCKPDQVDAEDAKWLLEASHGSVVHNNNWKYDLATLESMMKYAGYRYFLKEADLSVDDRTLNTRMVWQNLGFAPNYPKMGQNFQLQFHLLDYSGSPVYSAVLPVDISSWFPAPQDAVEAGDYDVEYHIQLPDEIKQGKYLAAVDIFDLRTGKSILLAMGGRDVNGLYVLAELEVK